MNKTIVALFLAAVLACGLEALESFVCDGADLCNQGDDPQYCSSEENPRCVYCYNIAHKCFTRTMPFNCTTDCLERNEQQHREKACTQLRDVPHLSHNGSATPQAGDVVAFQCNTGYHVKGPTMVKCSYGEWSPDPPTCEETFCGVPEVHHGTIPSSSRSSSVNTKVHFQCHKGYRPVDHEGEATCQPDGTWQNLLCVEQTDEGKNEKACSQLGDVPHSSHNGSATPQAGDVAAFQCNTGYHMKGSTMVKCSYGEWSPDPPTCEETFCGKPEVDHGTIPWSSMSSSAHTKVQYQCHKGYRPVDHEGEASCQPDGTWQNLLCVEQTDENKYGVIIGLGCLLGCSVLVIIGLLWYIIVLKKTQNKNVKEDPESTPSSSDNNLDTKEMTKKNVMNGQRPGSSPQPDTDKDADDFDSPTDPLLPKSASSEPTESTGPGMKDFDSDSKQDESTEPKTSHNERSSDTGPTPVPQGQGPQFNIHLNLNNYATNYAPSSNTVVQNSNSNNGDDNRNRDGNRDQSKKNDNNALEGDSKREDDKTERKEKDETRYPTQVSEGEKRSTTSNGMMALGKNTVHLNDIKRKSRQS